MKPPVVNSRRAGTVILALLLLVLTVLSAACNQPDGADRGFGNGDDVTDGGGNGNGDGPGEGGDDGGPGDDDGGNGDPGADDDDGDGASTGITVNVSDLEFTGSGTPMIGQRYRVTFRWATGIEGADTLTCRLSFGDGTPDRVLRDSCLGPQRITHTYAALEDTTFVDLLVSH